MNFRQSILERLRLDFPNMVSLNGYENNYATFVKGYPSPENRNLPVVFYYIGQESDSQFGVSNEQDLTELKVRVGAIVGEFKDEGMLVDATEQTISDLKKFLNSNTTISNSAYARWDLVSVDGSPTIERARVETVDEPRYNFEEGRAEINITVSVTFYDFNNENLTITTN